MGVGGVPVAVVGVLSMTCSVLGGAVGSFLFFFRQVERSLQSLRCFLGRRDARWARWCESVWSSSVLCVASVF